VQGKSPDCRVAIVGAGPMDSPQRPTCALRAWKRGFLASPWHFGRTDAGGHVVRSNWGASHIADPKQELTLDAYCRQTGDPISKPIPLERFVDYGRWYQSQAVPNVERRQVRSVESTVEASRSGWRTERNYGSARGRGWRNRSICRSAKGIRWPSRCSGVACHRPERFAKVRGRQCL